MREACRYAEMCIIEVHPLPLRRNYYLPYLQRMFSYLSIANFKVILTHIKESFISAAKSPYLDMMVLSLSKIRLEIYPTDNLEASITFLEILATHYSDTKGTLNREAFASTLYAVLLSLVPTISAEVNVPRWGKVVQKMILKQSFRLCERSKYRPSTLKLVAMCLCLCDRSTFIQKWHGFAEVIFSFIMDGAISSTDYLLILTQLTWVYVNKYPEAFATASRKIWSLLSPLVPSKSRRLPFDLKITASYFFAMVNLVAHKQPVMALRDIILPLLEGSDRRHESEDYPCGRVTLAVICVLQFSACREKGKFPLELDGNFDIIKLCEDYIHYCPDVLSRDALDSIRTMLARAMNQIDQLLFDPTIYDIRKPISDSTTLELDFDECSLESTLMLLFQISSYMQVNSRNDAYMLRLIVKYVGHPEETLAEVALSAALRLLETVKLTGEEFQQIYLVWASLLDRIPDKFTHCLRRASQIAPTLWTIMLQLDEELLNAGYWVPIVGDFSAKIILLGLSGNTTISSSLKQIVAKPSGTDIAAKEVSAIIDLIKTQQAFPWAFNSITYLVQSCPGASSQVQSNLMSRAQEIQLLLTGKSQFADDTLVKQWGTYLGFLFRIGPPEISTNSMNRKSDVSKLLKYLTFSKSSHGNIDTNETMEMNTLDFFRNLIPLLQNDNELVCACLVEAVQAINPQFIDDLLTALEPLISQVSDDFCNVRYQLLKRNRKVDAIKIDLCKILTNLISSLMEVKSNPSSRAHRIVGKFILETFYFCSEIDADEFLPGLRVALAGLVKTYHDSVRSLPDRFEFFPFKLQTELFMTFRKWYEQRRLGAIPSSVVEEDDGPEEQSIIETEIIYAETIASLCYGLVSPLPQYRQDAIPSSQVLRWIDSLINVPWGPEIIERAVSNLLY